MMNMFYRRCLLNRTQLSSGHFSRTANMIMRQYATEPTPKTLRDLEGKRADPDPLIPPAHQLWTDRQVPPSPPQPQVSETDVLSHPLYTPIMRPYTGIGPMLKPLHWPEYDQSKPSNVKTGYPSPGAFNDFVFEDPNVSPIGDYPKVTAQWTNLKDPFKYWDQQGRRNYGEVVYDHDNFTDQWGPGAEMDPSVVYRSWGLYLGGIGLIYLSVYLWDPSSHLWFAEKEWPYDGLRVELGGDPKRPSDTYRSAPSASS